MKSDDIPETIDYPETPILDKIDHDMQCIIRFIEHILNKNIVLHNKDTKKMLVAKEYINEIFDFLGCDKVELEKEIARKNQYQTLLKRQIRCRNCQTINVGIFKKCQKCGFDLI